MSGLRWVLAAAVLMLLPVVVELAVRWWLRHRGAYYVFPPGLRLRLHPDPEVFPQCEPVVRFDINSDGGRGDEVPRSRPVDRLYRALVAGGSQPEGYLLDQDTSWPGASSSCSRCRRTSSGSAPPRFMWEASAALAPDRRL